MRCGAHDKPETVEDCQPNGFSKDMDDVNKERGNGPLKILSRAVIS